MRNYSLSFLLLISVLISCSKDTSSDAQKPLIEEVIISDKDQNSNYEFPVGSVVNFTAKFSDDTELGSYRFEVHFAGDAHSHFYDKDSRHDLSDSKWEFSKSGDLSGTSAKVSFSKTIDEDAKASPYHCIVYATDAQGNVADFKTSSFFVARTDMPVLTVNTPNFDNLSIAIGDSVKFEGLARGVMGLSKIKYLVRKLDFEKEEIIVDKEFIISSTDDKEYVFSDYIKVPAGASPGAYLGILLASDKNGSVGEMLFAFNAI